MYVDEIFSGLDYANFPKIASIENKMEVWTMVKSACDIAVFGHLRTPLHLPSTGQRG